MDLGCRRLFYTYGFPTILEFGYAQDLLCLGAHDSWNFVTKNYSPTEKSAVTWEQFVEKFKAECVQLAERERHAQEYISLKQTLDLVTEITKMLTKRVLFFPEYASSKQVQKSRYLSMLKTEIREFISNNQYKTVEKMQEHD